MAKDNKKLQRLWDGIYENDFDLSKNIEEVDIAEYDKEMMTYYALNINMWRQLLKLSDSLKPVERRILYALYLHKAFPGKKLKSTLINGFTAIYHAHGDSYPTLVNMSQDWKKQVPLIKGYGNFGNAAGEFYAADRYTEACMSQYAQECFFDDYDDECVEMVFNSTSDLDEPITLPSKFPNILVNGGTGIAIGNAFCIPTYNIFDIIDVCKKVMVAPDTADVFMIPDLPSGCQILDDGHTFQDIINEGKGTLKMRADAEIIDAGKNWVIKITSIPWMRSLQTIKAKVVKLHKDGIISIKDPQDHSYPVKNKDGSISTMIDYRIIIDKAHDPHVVLNKLYSMTDLQYSAAVDFKVVIDSLEIAKFNMRDLINAWLNERRSYKRRLFNKRLTKISARIDLLTILIYLLQADNLDKTVKIIRSSNSEDAINQLMKLAKMTSYQAGKIYGMPLSAFTKDARARYMEEKKKLEKERDELMSIIRSEKKIDKIISDELEDLRKYGKPRRSTIVEEETGVRIADTTHQLIVSRQGMVKKLPFYEDNQKKNTNFGSFKLNDYPTHQIVIHNSANVTFIDNFGWYSTIPVHSIDNTEPAQYGHKVFDLTKLSGRIVSVMETYDTDLIERLTKKLGTPYLVTVSENGYAKKTPMATYIAIKNSKHIRAMNLRVEDSLAFSDVMVNQSRIIIFSEKGFYRYTAVEYISEQSKDATGNIALRVDSGDKVSGYAPVGIDDDYVVIITEKGMVKKVKTNLFGALSKKLSSSDPVSMMTLDTTDKIRFASGIKSGQKVVVALRSQVITLKEEDIPDQTKKGKGKKLIPSSPTSNIIAVSITK